MVVEHEDSSERLPLQQMRQRVRDLLTPKPWIYWTDFLCHCVLTWAAFVVSVRCPPWSVLQAAAWAVSVFALYRCVIFIHELAHLRRGSFGAFRWVWNLTIGLPVLLPSFIYSGVHNHHHRKQVYGTVEDGEYYPFAARAPLEMAGFLALNILLPGLLVLRFVVLAPVAWMVPRFHRLLLERGSSLTLDAQFKRTPSDRDDVSWRLQELLAFAYGATALALAATGILPWRVLATWYAMVSGGLLVNAVRTLVAHRYQNASRAPMTITQQFLDSVDIPGHPLFTALWAPVGLRYHATHHLFPSMPYHNLGKAYRRLHAAFPEIYGEATRSGLLDALRQIWNDSRAHRRRAASAATAAAGASSATGGLLR